MKYLCVDYGDVRTGLAASDISEFLASGIGYIKEGGMRNTARRVAEEAKKQGAGKIIVGLPKNMDGSEGERSQVVRAFVTLLEAETDVPVELYDERLSTMEAHRYLNMTGTVGKSRKKVVDTLSAQIILQDYLDSRKR